MKKKFFIVLLTLGLSLILALAGQIFCRISDIWIGAILLIPPAVTILLFYYKNQDDLRENQSQMMTLITEAMITSADKIIQNHNAKITEIIGEINNIINKNEELSQRLNAIGTHIQNLNSAISNNHAEMVSHIASQIVTVSRSVEELNLMLKNNITKFKENVNTNNNVIKQSLEAKLDKLSAGIKTEITQFSSGASKLFREKLEDLNGAIANNHAEMVSHIARQIVTVSRSVEELNLMLKNSITKFKENVNTNNNVIKQSLEAKLDKLSAGIKTEITQFSSGASKSINKIHDDLNICSVKQIGAIQSITEKVNVFVKSTTENNEKITIFLSKLDAHMERSNGVQQILRSSFNELRSTLNAAMTENQKMQAANNQALQAIPRTIKDKLHDTFEEVTDDMKAVFRDGNDEVKESIESYCDSLKDVESSLENFSDNLENLMRVFTEITPSIDLLTESIENISIEERKLTDDEKRILNDLKQLGR